MGSHHVALYLPAIANLLLTAVCVWFILKVNSKIKDAHASLSSVTQTVTSLFSQVADFLWLPLAVTVVCNYFKITPSEVESEYRKEADSRRWIVRHVYPDNELTRKFTSSFHSRFLTSGYDYKPRPPGTVLVDASRGAV